tara:strand:+ start:373 stop:549 length:177 start_codon:yes stop_codon:yes gene_type:complete
MIEDDMGFLLKIHDEYQDGKINLNEAIRRAQQVLDLSEDSLEKVFTDIERNNVVKIAG